MNTFGSVYDHKTNTIAVCAGMYFNKVAREKQNCKETNLERQGTSTDRKN